MIVMICRHEVLLFFFQDIFFSSSSLAGRSVERSGRQSVVMLCPFILSFLLRKQVGASSGQGVRA